MKTYQYIEQPYKSPLNLDILNSTFSNLETLHQKAIQTNSELKSAIAQLPLNESEEAFKDGLYNEIQQTIDDNTTEGNLAGAYDNLLKFQGDILTNKGLIGRINAQKNYLTHKQYIDAFDIPENYKEMYRELNPYYYKDRVDENGNVIGGTTWEPTIAPTKMVDLNTIVTQGINRAAIEKGNSYVTQWLDSKGNPTTDPSKAFDGVIYNEITSQYERLGHDKIMKSIYSVIEETPGAKESLRQDYDVAVYEYRNKNINNGILNIDGTIKTEQEYLDYRIEPAAQVSSYDRKISQTTFGQGLITFKKADRDVLEQEIKETQRRKEEAKKEEKENQRAEFLNNLSVGGRGGNIHITVPGVKIKQNKNILYNEIIDNLKQIGVSDEDINNLSPNYDILNRYIDSIPRTINNYNDLNNINILLRQFKQYDAIYDNIINKNNNKNDFIEYDLNCRLKAGEKLVYGNSGYENTLINNINEFLSLMNEFNTKYNITNENNIGVFPSSDPLNRRMTYTRPYFNPNVGSKYIESKNISFLTNNNLIGYDLNNITSDELLNFIWYYSENVSNFLTNGIIENKDNTFKNYIEKLHNLSNTISIRYKYVLEQTDKSFISDKELLNYETINSIELLGDNTFSENSILKAYNTGLINYTEFNSLTKKYNEKVINTIKSTNFSQHLLYKGVNGQTLELVDQKDILTEGNNIRQAIDEGRYTIKPAHVANLEDPITNTLGGYYITITPDYDKIDSQDEKAKSASMQDKSYSKTYDKNTYTYYIPGIGLESAADILFSDEHTQLNNFYQVLGDTQGTYNIYDVYDNKSTIGTIKINGIDDSRFKLNIFNDKYDINRNSAIILTSGFDLLQNIKDVIKINDINLKTFNTEHPEAIKELDVLAKELSDVTNQSLNTIENMILYELTL